MGVVTVEVGSVKHNTFCSLYFKLIEEGNHLKQVDVHRHEIQLNF